jgi:hypothetical protein
VRKLNNIILDLIIINVKAQSKEQNLLVASELEFQDEVWKKVEERTRLYTRRQGSAEPLTRVCNSAVTTNIQLKYKLKGYKRALISKKKKR